jgi:hypothetical protein
MRYLRTVRGRRDEILIIVKGRRDEILENS